MGISVNDLLKLEFFRDFKVVAGRNGLDREVQGVAIADAPDGYRFGRGKELCFSSGYMLANEPEYIKRSLDHEPGLAAMVIKVGRYLKEVPEEYLNLFDEKGMPLIIMPDSIPWMEVINQVNVAVMNYAFQRFDVNANNKYGTNSRNYKEQKIQKLLWTVEKEMEFPAFLYDVMEDKSYYSSANFKKVSQEYGLKECDYWDPSLIPHTAVTLCDTIHMTRLRLTQGESAEEPKISWVLIPILVGGRPQAYFGVMESRKAMDMYDEYSMRTVFLMLQGLYEQTAAARDASNIGFENLIHLALEYTEESDQKLVYQADQHGISMDSSYIYIVFRHDQSGYDIRSKRHEMVEMFRQCRIDRFGYLAFLSKEEGIILLKTEGFEMLDKEHIYALLAEYHGKLQKNLPQIKWMFGLNCEPRGLLDIKSCVEKCRKILKVGKIVAPEKLIQDCEELGILTWLDIPDEDLQMLLREFRGLLVADKNKELLQTLKLYLENNMNYSVTAEKMFVNINTIRRRIEKVNELIDIDWDNYFARTKIGLMLQFLQI